MKTLHLVPLLALLAMPACAKKKKPTDETAAATSASASASASASSTAKPKPARPTLPAPADVAAPPETAEKTASGLASVVLQAGQGTEKPGPADLVKVHYSGWTKDGEMFDSSVVRKNPSSFPVNRVIKGWTEGLQLMTVGEKRRFWIPAELAYGDKPRRGGAPSGQLTFDVELLEITKAPEVPADLKAPPPTAKKTASGLVYNVLKAGTGTEHPGPTTRVQVHYSGWDMNGKMFDSSVMRGRPATFSPSGVIKGWTEGLQLMVEGEKTRFWIPAELAYGEQPKNPGQPAGKLVFDVEIVKVLSPPPGLMTAKPAATTASAAPAATPAAPKPTVAAVAPKAVATPAPAATVAAPKPVATIAAPKPPPAATAPAAPKPVVAPVPTPAAPKPVAPVTP